MVEGNYYHGFGCTVGWECINAHNHLKIILYLNVLNSENKNFEKKRDKKKGPSRKEKKLTFHIFPQDLWGQLEMRDVGVERRNEEDKRKEDDDQERLRSKKSIPTTSPSDYSIFVECVRTLPLVVTDFILTL